MPQVHDGGRIVLRLPNVCFSGVNRFLEEEARMTAEHAAADAAGVAGSAAMFARDSASAALGMEVQSSGPGFAIVSMRVRDDMLNGYNVMHGGLIFALADTAFAIACQETEAVTLAAGAEISFLRPVKSGELLTAFAERRILSGRSGIYDVRIADETGAVVAEFRGHSRVTTLPIPGRSG